MAAEASSASCSELLSWSSITDSHAAAAYDAGSAEGYVVQAVLAGHESGDDEDGALVVENSLADAGDTARRWRSRCFALSSATAGPA